MGEPRPKFPEDDESEKEIPPEEEDEEGEEFDDTGPFSHYEEPGFSDVGDDDDDAGFADYARAVKEFCAVLKRGDLDEAKKLQVVNNFFNQIPFISDAIHWKQQDYWATPLELLGSNGGDCEDYSIAKYLTLRELGVADGKLRITYVKALKLNEAHMVLTYYSSPSAEPVILDNLEGDILPASQRKDLLPVYSFNGESLWLNSGLSDVGQLVGGSERIAPWRDLLRRMSLETVT